MVISPIEGMCSPCGLIQNIVRPKGHDVTPCFIVRLVMNHSRHACFPWNHSDHKVNFFPSSCGINHLGVIMCTHILTCWQIEVVDETFCL